MTDLRQVANRCLEAALQAVDARRLVREALTREAAEGEAAERKVTLIAVGKAAAGMTRGALDALGAEITGGLVVVPEGSVVDMGLEADTSIDVLRGGHPLPTSGSVRAAERIRQMAEGASARERFLVLISGGASALAVLPAAGLSLRDLELTTDGLLKAGASIDELNTVRKHLDEIKGGGLARMLAPSRVTGLVISDVVGDRLDVIASGPLTPDPTVASDAIRVLERHGLWSDAPQPLRDHLRAEGGGGARRNDDTLPGGDSAWRRVDVRIIGSNRLALVAAVEEAGRHGFESRVVTASLEGEARRAGARLARLGKAVREQRRSADPPACLLAGGETTVTVTGDGVGGRNQELALSAAIELDGVDGMLLAAMGSDGVDGPTDAAGAWVDGATVERGRDLGLSAREALDTNDAYTFFSALGNLIVTGPTGTNVMDLSIVLVE